MVAFALLGILSLALGLWLLAVIPKVEPRSAARILKASAGVVVVGLAVFLSLRGLVPLAVPLGVVGLVFVGWLPFSGNIFTQDRPSRIRSTYLEMEFDPNSGAMRGRFVSGCHRGAELEQLPTAALIAVLSQVDAESRALLMAYLDRRDARWRENAQGDAASGRRTAMNAKMTDDEAYQILGLEPGATVDAIVRAHRRLMKKLHPDYGGSTYLAARINESKEVLLRRHR